MSKALVLGAAASVFSAANASAQVYAEPVADLAVPADGYATPAFPPVYTAPPVYAAPVYTPPAVYVVPAPVYTAPVVTAPVVSEPIYAYAPGYWGGYRHVWHGYGPRHWWRYTLPAGGYEKLVCSAALERGRGARPPSSLCAVANSRHQNTRLIGPSIFSHLPSSSAEFDNGGMKYRQ
jgi:hypothetical protein